MIFFFFGGGGGGGLEVFFGIFLGGIINKLDFFGGSFLCFRVFLKVNVWEYFW